MNLERDGQWVTDTEVPQLVLRLTETSKTFVARWSSKKDNKRKQNVIAKVGEISVGEARDRVRKMVAQDANPSAETLRDIFQIWDANYSSKISAGHADEMRRSWRKHIEPDLGSKKLSRLTTPTLQQWYDKKISEHPVTPSGKTADKPHSAATVNRWIAYISKLCSIARANGYMVGNPVEALEQSTPHRRLKVFTRDDIKELSDSLTAAKDRYPIGVALIRFLTNFPCRGTEARDMQWDDLDLKAGTWTIPAERYKTQQDKVFPLGPLQIDHLRSLPRWSDTYVFPMVTDANRPVAKSHQRYVWEKLRPKPMGIHTLRKTIATLMLNDDMPLEIVSKLLGHSSTLVTQQAYAHLDPQVAGKHLERWGAILEDDEEKKDFDPEMVKMLEAQAAMEIKREIS
ncbi:tyrosine-type recombinase/integrase [Roseovarius sp. B08]|uniref:tyrosine-type recombinase/integrase n=1 Tax=Roseovarius sp. B08 TaxID=3449223 RepID=UPI003EDC2900